MKQTTRRRFLELTPLAGVAVVAACSPAPAPPAPAPAPAPAAAPAAPTTVSTPASSSAPLVDEKDPQAVALSYVADARNVDKTRFPAYQSGSNCANCQLYQGAATDPAAPCPLFAGKRVQSGAWCQSWVKKA